MGITLKQLAELSGCSIRTVDRVLKGSGPVARDKRERIEELVRLHRYVPNNAARSLKLNDRTFVGIITSDGRSELHSRKLYDLAARLESVSFHPMLSHFSSDPEQLDAILRSWSGLADTIIFSNVSGQEAARAVGILQKKHPQRWILLDPGAVTLPGAFLLQIDRAAGIAEAVDHLAATGHRRILRWGAFSNRDEGWIRARGRHPELEILQLPRGAEFVSGYSGGDEVIASGADAVVFDTDRAAAGFLRFAVDRGIAVPQRISVVGFDDEPYCPMLAAPLASIAHPTGELNRAATEIVSSGRTGGGEMSFETHFILRGSVAARQ